MVRSVIIRTGWEQKQTLGTWQIFDAEKRVFDCVTLELPFLGNQQYISCIPPGENIITKHHTTRFGDHFRLKDVYGRDWILVHTANYVRQLKGCIAVGERYADIDGDGLRDVTSSRHTLDKIVNLLPDESRLIIVNA